MRGALLVDMQQPHLFAVHVALSLCILSARLIKPGRGIYLKIQTKQKQRGKKKMTPAVPQTTNLPQYLSINNKSWVFNPGELIMLFISFFEHYQVFTFFFVAQMSKWVQHNF